LVEILIRCFMVLNLIEGKAYLKQASEFPM